MGRDKEQSLIDKLVLIKMLIKNGDYEKARKEFRFLNNENFIKNLSIEDAKAIYSYIEDMTVLLSKREIEISRNIDNSLKVKDSYLK